MNYLDKLNELLTIYRSQRELAFELDVSSSILSRWLSNECAPRKKQLLTIDCLYNKIFVPKNQSSIFDECFAV